MAEQFSAAPKVVKPKNKYKQQPQEQQEDEIKLIYNNLMWDKRIVRGNTYAAIVTSKQNDAQGASQTRMGYKPKETQQITGGFDNSNRRANIEIFTDQFVETLTDKPPHYEYGSQTDPLASNKVIRHQMQPKMGKDTQTQIWDEQLFDFDYECESLLNVLCGRTLETSRMEVLQEEEIRIMGNRQQELRLYEKEENRKIQNMYQQEDQLQQDNLKVIDKYKKQKQIKVKTHKKIFSRVLAKQFLRDIKPNSLNSVQTNGFFKDPIDISLVKDVMPAFYQQTLQENAEKFVYLEEVHKLVCVAKDSIVKDHKWAKEVERSRRQQIIQKRQQKARQKQQRKQMKQQQQWMKDFQIREKKYLEQQEQRKRKQLQEQQNKQKQEEQA